MIYQYSNNYTIDIDTVCENYTRDTDSILESYNIVLSETVDVKALGDKIKELVKSLLEKAKEFFAKLHYNLVKIKTNIITGKDMKSAIDTFMKSYKDISIKNLPIIVDDIDYSGIIQDFINNSKVNNDVLKELANKVEDSNVSFDEFKNLVDDKFNKFKEFEDDIDKKSVFLFFPKGDEKVDEYKLSSNQAKFVVNIIKDDNELKKIKNLPENTRDVMYYGIYFKNNEGDSEENKLYERKVEYYTSFERKYISLIFTKLPNTIGKYLYRYMTTCLKIFNQVISASKESNTKSSEGLKKFKEIEEGIETNDVKRLRNALTSLIYVDRDFANSTVVDQIKYIESKGIKLKDDNLEGELVTKRREPPYTDDDFSRAVFELKNNFCDERLNEVKKLGKELYGKESKNESTVIVLKDMILTEAIFNSENKAEVYSTKNVVITEGDLKNLGVLKKKVTRIVDSDLNKMSSKDISNQIYLLVDCVVSNVSNAFIKNEWRTDYKNQISNIVKASNRYLSKSDKNKILSKLKYNNITRDVKATNKVVDKIVKDVDIAISTLRS